MSVIRQRWSPGINPLAVTSPEAADYFGGWTVTKRKCWGKKSSNPLTPTERSRWPTCGCEVVISRQITAGQRGVDYRWLRLHGWRTLCMCVHVTAVVGGRRREREMCVCLSVCVYIWRVKVQPCVFACARAAGTLFHATMPSVPLTFPLHLSVHTKASVSCPDLWRVCVCAAGAQR